MSGGLIAPYVSQGVDAGDELRSLGLDQAEIFLLYLKRIAAAKTGYRSYWKGRAYRGRTTYRKDLDGCFIVYVVETERDNSVRVTLICAGRIAAFAGDAAIQAVVAPRLQDFFR
jgi:hypothetical protein